MPIPVMGRNAGGPTVDLKSQILGAAYKVVDLGGCPPPEPSPWPYFYEVVTSPVGTIYPDVYLWGTGSAEYYYYIGVLPICGGNEYFTYTYSSRENTWYWNWAATYFRMGPFTPPSLPPNWTLPPGYSPPPSSTPSSPTPPPIPLTLNPALPAFSPNGDGSKDTDAIEITSSSPWTLSVDEQGTIASGPATSADGTSFDWGGAVGGQLPDGSYVLRLHPSDGEPDKTATVIIDTQPPRISGATLEAISVDASGVITVGGNAAIADQGLAGINPASATATLVGYGVSGAQFTPAADGSSVTYQATITPPMLASLTGAPQVCPSSGSNKTGNVYIDILAFDKAGNGAGENLNFKITYSPLENRGLVRSGRGAYAVLSTGSYDEPDVEEVGSIEYDPYALTAADKQWIEQEQQSIRDAEDGTCAKAQSSTIVVDGVVLQNGLRVSANDALTFATDFLGPGYTEESGGRFVSADGTRVVRMGDSDILGKHGGGPHMNFEVLEPNPAKPGKMKVVENYHIFLQEK